MIETFSLFNVEFQDVTSDFKRILEGLQCSSKIRKVTFGGMVFEHDSHGKGLGRMLLDSKTIREIEFINCEFLHPKSFFDMAHALINEKCRLNVLKMQGIYLTNLESKILQLVLMKNRQIHTLDLSFCKIEEPQNLIYFICKID